MDSRYVVEVSSPAGAADPETREQLGEALRLTATRVDALIRRLPDVVTRPLPRPAAEAVAGRFRSAGLDARVVPAGTGPAAAEPPARTPAPASPPTLFEAPAAGGVAAEPKGADPLPVPEETETRTPTASPGVWLETDTPLPPARRDTPVPQAPPVAAAAPVPGHDPHDTAAYEAITPAELLARLRGEQAGEDAPGATVSEAEGALPGSASARLKGRLRGKLLELAVAPALFTLLGTLAGTWYGFRTVNPEAGFLDFLGGSSFMGGLAGGGILLVIGVLFAGRRATALTRNVRRLTDRADAISRGELEDSMEFTSGDEFEELAEAIERMRVGMRGAFERLRRSRRL